MKKGNGSGDLVLTKEERLELQNIELRRQMLQQKLNDALGKLENEQRMVVKTINDRLGIDVTKFEVNLDTGKLMVQPAPETQASN